MSFRSLLLCSLQLDFCFSFIPLIAKRRRSVLFYSAHYRTASFQCSDLTYCPQLLTSATRSPGVRRRFARCPYHMAPFFPPVVCLAALLVYILNLWAHGRFSRPAALSSLLHALLPPASPACAHLLLPRLQIIFNRHLNLLFVSLSVQFTFSFFLEHFFFLQFYPFFFCCYLLRQAIVKKQFFVS
ncbi:hypothetical protein ABFX02_14G000800 [Erythranthe guttata]